MSDVSILDRPFSPDSSNSSDIEPDSFRTLLKYAPSIGLPSIDHSMKLSSLLEALVEFQEVTPITASWLIRVVNYLTKKNKIWLLERGDERRHFISLAPQYLRVYVLSGGGMEGVKVSNLPGSTETLADLYPNWKEETLIAREDGDFVDYLASPMQGKKLPGKFILEGVRNLFLVGPADNEILTSLIERLTEIKSERTDGTLPFSVREITRFYVTNLISHLMRSTNDINPDLYSKLLSLIGKDKDARRYDKYGHSARIFECHTKVIHSLIGIPMTIEVEESRLLDLLETVIDDPEKHERHIRKVNEKLSEYVSLSVPWETTVLKDDPLSSYPTSNLMFHEEGGVIKYRIRPQKADKSWHWTQPSSWRHPDPMPIRELIKHLGSIEYHDFLSFGAMEQMMGDGR